MKQLTESLFDKDIASKNLSPEEIAKFYKDYKYNTDNGRKDCLGNSLKKGDVVLVTEDPYGHSKLCIGVYSGYKGRLCDILISAYDLTYSKKIICSNIIKIDPPEIK